MIIIGKASHTKKNAAKTRNASVAKRIPVKAVINRTTKPTKREIKLLSQTL